MPVDLMLPLSRQQASILLELINDRVESLEDWDWDDDDPHSRDDEIRKELQDLMALREKIVGSY